MKTAIDTVNDNVDKNIKAEQELKNALGSFETNYRANCRYSMEKCKEAIERAVKIINKQATECSDCFEYEKLVNFLRAN